MAISLQALLDDKKFIAALERMIGKLNDTKKAGKDTGDVIDKGTKDSGKGVEGLGERFEKLKNTMNKMMLGSVGFMAMAKAGQFAGEVFGKVAEEAKGVDKATFDAAKKMEMFGKAAQFDFTGAAMIHFFKDIEFEAARLEKRLTPIQERMKAIDARGMIRNEEATGTTADKRVAEERITAIHAQREDIIASIHARESIMGKDRLRNQQELIDELKEFAADNRDLMTGIESKAIQIRIAAAATNLERAKTFELDKIIAKLQREFNEEQADELANLQSVTRELEKVKEYLRTEKKDQEGIERARERALKLAQQQVALQRQSIEYDREQLNINRQKNQEAQKARDEERIARGERVAGIAKELAAQGGQGGGGGRRRGLLGGGMIPNMMMRGPGLFRGPGIMGAPMPDWPGDEGGGGGGLDLGGVLADANRRGVGGAIRGRRDDIERNRDKEIAEIRKTFAQRRQVLREEWDKLNAELDANTEKKAGDPTKMGADEFAQKEGVRKMLREQMGGGVNREEAGAIKAARDKAEEFQAKVARNVRKEVAGGDAPKDVEANKEAAIRKAVDNAAKQGIIQKDQIADTVALIKMVDDQAKKIAALEQEQKDARALLQNVGQKQVQRAVGGKF